MKRILAAGLQQTCFEPIIPLPLLILHSGWRGFQNVSYLSLKPNQFNGMLYMGEGGLHSGQVATVLQCQGWERNNLIPMNAATRMFPVPTSCPSAATKKSI